MKYRCLFICLIICWQVSGQLYSTIDGVVHFKSNAPLEIIEAESDQLQGVLDIEKKLFAFKIYIRSFEGFNSDLQKVHFYENYMEVKDFPNAIFKGKILEPIKNGSGEYRAKGILEIHGESVERIIYISLDVSDKTALFTSTFLVPLQDHDIDLPRIVYQKIAENIEVKVNGTLDLKE